MALRQQPSANGPVGPPGRRADATAGGLTGAATRAWFRALAGRSTTRDNDTYRASPEGLIPPRRTAATHRQERTIVDRNQPPVAAKAVFPEALFAPAGDARALVPTAELGPSLACEFAQQPISSIGIHHLVRHAYLLGQNDPYKALETTLKAEINEAVWETLHSDTSRPFDKPEPGRIG